MDSKTVCICIPTWQNLTFLQNAVESILGYTRNCPYRLFVVNNGNDPATEQYLQGLVHRAPLEWMNPSENLGFIKGTNLALKQVAGDEHALLLNDDVQVTDPYWLSRLTETLESRSELGAVGPTSNYVLGWQQVQYSSQLPMVHEVPFLVGFCMLIKDEALTKVGLLDERFGMGMQDDLDYSLRLTDAGYKMAVDRSVFVLHFGSQSLPRLGEDVGAQESRTRQMLINKWGEESINALFAPLQVMPTPENYTALLERIDEHEWGQAQWLGETLYLLLHPESVVDWGCASGLYLVPFVERGCYVTGYDTAPGAGKHLPAGGFENKDISHLVPTLPRDLALCIETAEHLPPEAADTLVENVARSSHVVFWSAAQPGQGGLGHLNEQPIEYWREKFGKFAFREHPQWPLLRKLIAENPECQKVQWLISNAILLSRDDV